MADELDAAEGVRRAVEHFVEHWPGTQTAFMAKVADQLSRREARFKITISGGRSAKALSAWKSLRRQLPESPEILIALRTVAGCKCTDKNSGRLKYSDELLKYLLHAARRPKAQPSKETLSSESTTLQRVVALSDSAVTDCDLLFRSPTGLQLRLTDVSVERTLEDVIIRSLRSGAITAVRGEAGYGKTVLMWQLHRQLTQADRLALLIPATALLRGARGDRGDAAVTIDDLKAALRAATRGHHAPVLLVDTVDLLTHSPQTRAEVSRLLRTAAECRVPMVVTCRPAEAALLHLDDEDSDRYHVPIRPLQLRAFNADERREAIKAYAQSYYGDNAFEVIEIVQDAQVRGRPLREVVANPLTLRMLFELYAGDGKHPDPDIDSIGLYTLMWVRRVVTDMRDNATPSEGPDLSIDAELTALAMLSHGQIDLNRSDIISWLSGSPPAEKSLDLLVRRSILTLREETQRLWFWHQTWFEYTAARAVARLGDDASAALVDFVAEAPYDLLFGEVASQLILLAGRSPEMSMTLADKLLAKWLRIDEAGIQILALRTYARYREPSPELQAAAASAMREADSRTCKDFLRLLPTISHPTADRWLTDLAVLWQRGDVQLPVLEALIRLAAGEPTAAAAFVRDHECMRWLLDRPPEQWRYHESPHLRLLTAISPDEHQEAAAEAMRFWEPLAAAGIIPGLTDVMRFLVQSGHIEDDHYNTISTTVRELQSTDKTFELQNTYADLVILAGDTPTDLNSILDDIAEDHRPPENVSRDHDQKEALEVLRVSEVWRRAMLRAVGRSAYTLSEPHEIDRCLEQLLTPANPTHLDYHATALAELLNGPRTTPHIPPATERVRRTCRSVLSAPEQRADLAKLFATAIRYARLDGVTLLKVLPEDTVDHYAWFSMDPQGTLLVEATAVGNASADAALQWSVTEQGQTRVPPLQMRRIARKLQRRAENAPRLLAHIVSIARVKLDSSTMCTALERLPGYVITAQPDVLKTILDTRTQLVRDKEPDRKAKGYILWRALVRNGLDEPPGTDELAATLTTSRYSLLVTALIGIGIESIDRDAWPEQDVSRLIEVLEPLVTNGEMTSREPIPTISDGDRHLARQFLVGLLSRTAPLSADRNDRHTHVRQVLSYVFNAGYDVTQRRDLNAFTPCVTNLGWLIDRLVHIDRNTSMDTLLTIAERLHALQPSRAHWRQSLAMKWQYTVTSLINTLNPSQRRNLVERLLPLDTYILTHAVKACVTREQAVPAWILEIIDHLPDDVRGQLRTSIFEHARERSHRRWDVASWLRRQSSPDRAPTAIASRRTSSGQRARG